MSSDALVSIGVPVYNGERYLAATLQSLLSQDHEHLELIICDNASTDRTADVALECAARDKRVRYNRSAINLGAVSNFNRAFELAVGEYFMWGSAHDTWHPAALARALHVLDSDPGVVLAYPRTGLIGPDDEAVGVSSDNSDSRGLRDLGRYLEFLRTIGACTMIHGLIRRDALLRTGLFRKVWGADMLLLGDLSLQGAFAHIPETLFYRRDIRPGEGANPEAWKKRYLETLEGHASRKGTASFEQLFRELRNALLRLLIRSDLSLPAKLTAMRATMRCFKARFGVRYPADFVVRFAQLLRAR